MSRTILAARTDDSTASPSELHALLTAEGHDVRATVTATRTEHPETNLGPEQLARVTETVELHDATLVAIDGELTPAQTLAIGNQLPDGVRVYDRSRVILELFAERAGTEVARLQTRIARLEYERELQRELLAAGDVGGWWPDDEHRSIQAIERKLTKTRADLRERPDPRAEHRRRREQGFDLVALVGYTNAGKSTLLRRLADNLDLTDDHTDTTTSASVEDRLFETLDTTTRRASIADRRALVTDTVGFVSELPHELVASFDATFAAAYEANVVLLVVDGSDPLDGIERKLRVAREQLTDVEGTVLPVVNKADRIDSEHRAAVAGLFDAEPVFTSATDGSLVELRERVAEVLPTAETTLSVPNGDDAMALVSWCYDRSDVEQVEYDDSVEIRLAGKPSVVEEAKRRAEKLRSATQ